MNNQFSSELYDFFSDGYVVLESGIEKEFHNNAARKFESLVDDSGGEATNNRCCNNLLAVVPSLSRVIESPALTSFLTEILGRGYRLNQHKTLQPNLAYTKFGAFTSYWHRDAYFVTQPKELSNLKILDHTLWSAIVFYSPEDIVDPDNGPFAVAAGTQFHPRLPREINVKHTKKMRKFLELIKGCMWAVPMPVRRMLWQKVAAKAMPVPLKKGQILVMNHNLWHMGFPNISSRNRGVLAKFEFSRTRKPDAAGTPKYRLGNGGLVKEANAGWSLGSTDRLPALGGINNYNDDIAVLEYMYKRAASGEARAVQDLVRCMMEPDAAGRDLKSTLDAGSLRNCIAQAMVHLGEGQGEMLLKEIRRHINRDKEADGYFVYAVSNSLGLAARQRDVLDVILSVKDEGAWCRAQKAQAMGRLTGQIEAVESPLCGYLSDDNAFVRQCAAEALCNGNSGSDAVIEALSRGLEDAFRYVRYFCIGALAESDDIKVQKKISEFLYRSYMCEESYWESAY